MKIIESLFLGIIAAFGALCIEVVFYIFGNSDSFSSIPATFDSWRGLSIVVILPVIIEEFFKFIVIQKRLENYSLGRMLIINSMILGIGFGLVEISLIYFLNQGSPNNIQSVIEIIILHTLTAGLIGYLLSQLNPKKILTGIKVVLIASIIHLAYNIMIIYRNEIIDLVVLAFLSILALFLMINILLFERKLAS